MSEPELTTTLCEDRSTAKLLAIVSVEHVDRVRCGQSTCGHSVYRRIHVVREAGTLLVLGSTCFAKRYGTDTALGLARFGGGEGRPLTDAERQLLVGNTQTFHRWSCFDGTFVFLVKPARAQFSYGRQCEAISAMQFASFHGPSRSIHARLKIELDGVYAHQFFREVPWVTTL